MSELIDIFPDKGSYLIGDPVRLNATVDGPADGVLECRIFHLAVEVACLSAPITAQGTARTVVLEWLPPHVASRGYGVQAELMDASGGVTAAGSTAFDVLLDWTAYPRYGFLSDFSPKRTDVVATIRELTRFHINGLQFYDWQYRHDNPLPPTDVFLDPLDRRLSLITVKGLLDEAHLRGIASMAYVAVYAASMELWREEPDWALYDEHGEPIVFDGGFLGLMDPTQGTPWADHLQRRCDEILAALPFDGIHIDQYGEPRTAFNRDGDPVDLPTAFSDFVSDLRKRHPDAPITFNAVKNWPIDSLVTSPMDFVYIELWPDTPTYGEIGEIVERVHADSGYKPVVIALYIPAGRESNIRLADALIIAHGGSRIEIGEEGRLLSDPYFPLHEALPSSLHDVLRRYGDFRVRYGEFLGPTARPSQSRIQAPDGVCVVARDVPGWTVINLVNMSDITETRWDEVHTAPSSLTNVLFDVHTESEVRRVWFASPDGEDLCLQTADWSVDDGTVRMAVPSIEYWTMVAIEFKPGKDN
ncbi:MAG: glycoside hydrolase family 66 protein [Acidimicrobiia bacterium]